MSRHVKEYFTAARRCADWFVNNQIIDMATGDNGRFISEIKPKGFSRPIGPSIAWTTGMALQSLLMMYKRTKEERYLKSAKQAGEYLKSLQVLDPRLARNFGVMREINPQTDWCHPRDALSGAWGLLHLGLATKDKDCLQRAVLFAGWFKNQAFKNGYPAWSFFLDGRKTLWLKGSFHGGSALFFMDINSLTGDRQWLDKVAWPLLRTYQRGFVKKDGSIRIVVDPKTGKDLTGTGRAGIHIPPGWEHMHKFNDDFTALSLLRAYKLTKKERYLDTATQYLEWAIRNQNKDGSFGRPAVTSGCATLILELLDLAGITDESKYRLAAFRAGQALLSLQELKKRDKRVYGGIYGVSKGYNYKKKDTLNIRTAAYALAAFLKLEGKISYPCYTA